MDSGPLFLPGRWAHNAIPILPFQVRIGFHIDFFHIGLGQLLPAKPDAAAVRTGEIHISEANPFLDIAKQKSRRTQRTRI